MRALFVGLLLLVSFAAYGQGSAVVNCTPPTQNTDGSALAPAQIMGIRWSYGTVQGTYQTKLIAPDCASATLSNLPAGKVFIVASTLNLAGGESAFSSVLSKLIPAVSPPNPPTVPQPVTLAGPVFTLLITRDSVVLPQVGTVLAGKPCDPQQQLAFGGKAYMLVKVANVAPLPGQQIEAAWAVCQ